MITGRTRHTHATTTKKNIDPDPITFTKIQKLTQSGYQYKTKGMVHERKNKLDFIKTKTFCSAKDTVKRMRKKRTNSSQNGEKIVAK